MRIRGFFLLTIFFPVLIFSQESVLESSVKRLEWEASPGAQYYVVEIRREGLIIHTLETENNFIPLFLNPGEYQLRISVFNKFRKQASQSDWSPLTIFPSVQPVIESISPEVAIIDNEELVLEIEGTDFDENSLFSLIYRDTQISGTSLEKNLNDEKDSFLVTFSKEKIVPAEWDLVVENPSGKKYIKKGALIMERNSIPHIDSINPQKIYRNSNNGKVTIRGERFSPRVTLLINGETNDALTSGDVFFEKEIVFLINTYDWNAGNYKLSVMNDTGLISNEMILEIEDRPPGKEEKAKRERLDSNLFLGLSYKINIPVDKGDMLFETSPFGLGVVIRSKFDNSRIYKIPILRNIGFFMDLDFTYLSLKKVGFYEDLIFTGNLGLFYKSEYDNPFNFIISASLGPTYSFFLFENYQVKRSFDLSTNITLAVIYKKDSLIIEGGFCNSLIQYQYNTLNLIKPYLLYGWEF